MHDTIWIPYQWHKRKVPVTGMSVRMHALCHWYQGFVGDNYVLEYVLAAFVGCSTWYNQTLTPQIHVSNRASNNPTGVDHASYE